MMNTEVQVCRAADLFVFCVKGNMSSILTCSTGRCLEERNVCLFVCLFFV